MDLAAWLRAGRDRRKLTIEDVAKITKIQPRILEKLESGSLDGLPAEVFVKGFVRSFAKCVGLDESEAIDKYSAAQAQPPVAGAAGAVAKALVDTMSSSVRTIRASSPSIVVPPVADIQTAIVEVQATPVVEVQATPVVEVQATPVVEVQATPVVETQAPVIEAAPVTDPAAPLEVARVDSAIVDAVAAVEAAAQNGNKKKSRKNSKQRARGKKKAQQELATEPAANAQAELVAESVVSQATHEPIERLASKELHAQALDSQALESHALDTAVTSVFEKQSIETGPVAKIDAESIAATSIEAKTNDALDVGADITNGIPVEQGAVTTSSLADGSGRISQTVVAVDVTELATSETAASASTATPTVRASTASETSQTTAGSWQPTMPPLTTAPSAPWRRPNLPAQTASAYVVPTLVIDDADPDSADRERDDRIAKEPTRLSFLPPILLDREDRSARQGGLTLAVIILLIAATLTLSYLMRRPSPTGDGVTMLDGSSMLVG